MNTETWIVKTVENAKNIATKHLSDINLENVILFGLPEIDDRYGVWRVPLTDHDMHRLGEVVIDGKTSFIIKDKTTDVKILENKLLGRSVKKQHNIKIQKTLPHLSSLRNTIACGDAEDILADMPFESVDLILTSPPYFNARPEYAEYLEYEDYLSKMKRIIHKCHSVLNEGRFFVINISPVLIRRINRNSSSKRIAVPSGARFDFTWTMYLSRGLSLSVLVIARMLLTAPAMSIEPVVRYIGLIPSILFMWAMITIAQPVSADTLIRWLNSDLTSLAIFIEQFLPR